MTYNNRKKKFTERRDPDVPLTDAERKELTSRARNLCFYYMTRSDKTRKELKTRLFQKFIPADIIEEVLNEMEDDGYVDDAKLAVNFVRNKSEYANMGKRAIENKLYQKGIDKDLIQEATSSIDMEGEFGKAKDLALSRLYSTSKMDKQKRYTKIVSLVIRRGFTGDVAYRAVREAIDEEETELED